MNKAKGSEGAARGPALPDKMLGALVAIQEGVRRLEYMQSQIDKLTREELAKEEGHRSHMIRLNTAMTVLNGMLCAVGLSVPPADMITSAVHHADMLIARLGLGASVSEPPKANKP